MIGVVRGYLGDMMGFQAAQYVYSPVPDYETDLARLSENTPDPTGSVALFPGVVVTRAGMAPMLSAKSQPWKFQTPYRGTAEADQDQKVDFRLVTVDYSVRVYCTT